MASERSNIPTNTASFCRNATLFCRNATPFFSEKHYFCGTNEIFESYAIKQDLASLLIISASLIIFSEVSK